MEEGKGKYFDPIPMFVKWPLGHYHNYEKMKNFLISLKSFARLVK